MVYFLNDADHNKLKSLVDQDMEIGGRQILDDEGPSIFNLGMGGAFEAPYGAWGKLVDILSFDAARRSVNYVILDEKFSSRNRLYYFSVEDILYMSLIYNDEVLIDTRGSPEQKEKFNHVRLNGPGYIDSTSRVFTFLEEEFLNEHGLTRLLQ